MAYRWEQPIKDREELKPIIRTMGLQGHTCLFLGIVFAILGIVAGATGASLGLNSTGWLLLAIAVFVAGIPAWLTMLWARRLLGIEPKK
jgi:ABC-type lipoprotein release transport system permease subunit